LRDYGEYFTEGLRQGKTEQQISSDLGDPKEMARQIVCETESERKGGGSVQDAVHEAAETATTAAKGAAGAAKNALGGVWPILWKGLLVLGLLCLSPLIFGGVVTLGGFVLAVFGVLFGLVGLCGGMILAGIACVVASALLWSTVPATVRALLLTGSVALIAAGVLSTCLTVMLVRLLWSWCIRLFDWIRGKAGRKPGDPPPAGQPTPNSESYGNYTEGGSQDA
ncbi:MAG: hypothetical protein RR197_06900, partial [Oscillospiraceae bacterium]